MTELYWEVGKCYKTKGGWKAIVISIKKTHIDAIIYDEIRRKFSNRTIDVWVDKVKCIHEINGIGGCGPLHPLANSLGNFEVDHNYSGKFPRHESDSKIIFDHPGDLTIEEY